MAAPREVVPIIMELVKPQNVLDVGCGTGTWLKAFDEAGVSDYVGVDGDYIDRSQLHIAEVKFVAKDLRTKWSLERKFDLVLSLEVAEHLPEVDADLFVETLVNHAQDVIVFSAAIPGQGGQNHLNEQWSGYWQKKFARHGFNRYDCIRPRIWDNANVDVWYRQNVFLFKREDTLKEENTFLVAEIHPDLWQLSVARIQHYIEVIHGFEKGHAGIERSFRALLRAMRNRFLKS